MENEYLGDGLYARYDGYQICLMANSPTEPTDMVYLDPSVYANLQKFVNRIAAEQSVHLTAAGVESAGEVENSGGK